MPLAVRATRLISICHTFHLVPHRWEGVHVLETSSIFLIAPARTVFAQQTTDMCRMVRHSKNLLQKSGDPDGRPPAPPKTEGFRPTSEQRRNLAELLVRQRRTSAGGGMVAQGVPSSTFTSAFEPLADRPLGNT